MAYSVDAALRRVLMVIPQTVIKAAFGTKRNIEFYLRENVLYDIVQKDISLFGGKIEEVLIHEHWVTNDVSSNCAVIRIPPEAIGRRNILDFLEIVHRSITPQNGVSLPPLNTYQPTSHGMIQSAMDAYATKVFGMDQYLPPSERCTLRDGLLIVEPRLYTTQEIYARIRVGYDSEITNLTTVSFEPFIQVFLLATKMCLWRTLIDKGLSIESRIHELISDWNPESLQETYTEALRKFTASVNFDPDHAIPMWAAQYG